MHGRKEERPIAVCDEHGRFCFNHYKENDGVPAGTYVVAFAQLQHHGKEYVGPDGLRNLYNDPMTNAAKPELRLEHKAPGQIDCRFDLKTEGLVGIEKPGANAVTHLPGD
jgi:hypothetical protein